MKKSLLLFGLLLLNVISFAQLSKGGQPTGFKFANQWQDVPLYKMPAVDAAQLLAEDAVPDPEMKKPIRFGKAQFTSIVPVQATGSWHDLPSGKKLWQQRIKSAGAYTLSLGFRNVNLPKGSRLFIYNKDHSSVLGAFTYELTFVDNILATEQLNGDEVMIEYEVPASEAAAVPFELYRVSHDYRDINKILKSFGDAGACQVNINCPAGASYQDIKKSVAAIISSGSELCTGTLLNTTNQSGIPYFLTANHCYDNNAANWVFRFNWESPTCANPATGPTFQSVSGSTLKAKNAGTDFCLVQLGTTPPANYNIVYAGWDKSGAIPTSEVCISHPAIDIKKICNTALAATSSTYSGATTWRTGTWSNGCPEPGSSGSALFDQNKRVVGQLFGGPSACGQPASSMYDEYGKFSVSWTGGGTSATRLRDWLDPSNTNVNTTNIYDPNLPVLPYDARLSAIINPSPAGNCNTTITPSVTIVNGGTTTLTSFTIGYTVNTGAVTSYSWTGTLASTASITISLPSFVSPAGGQHTFRAFTSLPNGQPDGNTLNDTLSVAYSITNTTPVALPLFEGFESATFPPAGWTVTNPDLLTQWQRTTTAAATGNASAVKNNFDVDDDGQQDYLNTPFFSFPSTTADYKMNFKVAYARYDNTSKDSLKVEVSTDCGNTWTTIYRKGGASLATAPTTTSSFVPTASQWRRDSISLIQYRNTPSLQIRFVNYSNYGNNIYLDDVNITGSTTTAPQAAFTVSGACIMQNITLTNTSTGATSYSWSMPGGTPASSTATSPIVTYSTAGTYAVTLTATNASGSTTATQQLTVNALPNPVAVRNGTQLSLVIAYATYQWYKDGVAITGANGNTVNISGHGNYYAIVTDANGCSGQSNTIVVPDLGIGHSPLGGDVLVMPNPAEDYILIKQTLPGNARISVSIYNQLGQIAATQEFADAPASRMDISSLPSGIYTVRISKGNSVAVKKLTVR